MKPYNKIIDPAFKKLPIYEMRYIFYKTFILLFFALIFFGCHSIHKKEEESAVRKPDFIISLASLNLENLNKRIEEKHIIELAKVLKREQIEVLAIQGISRYPGVASRIDFVDELSLKTDWHSAFGEMTFISGRQSGNAVFSSYPILSKYNQSFEHIKSAEFEAGLQVLIDAGLRPLVVVSVLLPHKATMEVKMQCIQLVAETKSEKSSTIVITGNIPAAESVRNLKSFKEVPQSLPSQSQAPTILYSANSSFQMLGSRTVNTDLGRLNIVQLALFR